MREGYKIKEGDEVIDHTRDSKVFVESDKKPV
jgi:hypothetical protein